MTSKTNHEMNRKKQLDNRAASKNKQPTSHRRTWTKPKTADETQVKTTPVDAVNREEKNEYPFDPNDAEIEREIAASLMDTVERIERGEKLRSLREVLAEHKAGKRE
jgi:hypothetical protein